MLPTHIRLLPNTGSTAKMKKSWHSRYYFECRRAASDEVAPCLLEVASGRSNPVAQVGRRRSFKAHEPTERTEEIYQFSIMTLVSSMCQRDGPRYVSRARAVRSGEDVRVVDALTQGSESGHGLT